MENGRPCTTSSAKVLLDGLVLIAAIAVDVLNRFGEGEPAPNRLIGTQPSFGLVSVERQIALPFASPNGVRRAVQPVDA